MIHLKSVFSQQVCLKCIVSVTWTSFFNILPILQNVVYTCGLYFCPAEGSIESSRTLLYTVIEQNKRDCKSVTWSKGWHFVLTFT